VGREIFFDRDRSGRIEQIRVPSPASGTLTFARFRYSAAGDLLEATNADGHTTTYAYDEHHRLIRQTYPSGLSFHYVYDSTGRCVETWGATLGPDPALASDVPDVLTDGTPAKGIYHSNIRFYSDDYIEASDSIRTQRFEAAPDGRVSKAVSATGGVTTREFDEDGNVIAQTDPTGATWQWDYDEFSRVIAETNPMGHQTSLVRDGGGRITQLTNAAGGVTELVRDEHGELSQVVTPVGGVQCFARNARGSTLRALDARGGEYLFEYDAHENCVSKTFPTGARYTFTYDYWGRRLSDTAPDGSSAHYTYSDSGRVLRVTDSLGRIKRFTYDTMGNLAAFQREDGRGFRIDYGGLNWAYLITHVDGSQISCTYNREGWPVEVTNESGEKHRVTYTPDGHLLDELDFAGRLRQYGVDAFGRLTSAKTRCQEQEIEYDVLGQVIRETGNGENRREFAYNPRGDLTRFVSDDVEVNWQLDPEGNVIAEEMVVADTPYRVQIARNVAGDRTKVTSSLGLALEYSRDKAGRVASIAERNGTVLRLERDVSGVVTRRWLGDTAAIRDVRDSARRLVETKVTFRGSEPSRATPAWLDEAVEEPTWRYSYDDIDEVRSVASPQGHVEYDYDARRRLIHSKESSGATREWRVDPNSNYYGSERAAYAAGNVLMAWGSNEYEYDSDGYLLRKTVHGPNGGMWLYHWNGWGHLVSVERPDGRRVEFKYDAFARRVLKRVSSADRVEREVHYIWDLINVIHEVEVDPESKQPLAVVDYLFEDDDQSTPLGHRRRTSGGDWVYYVGDFSGTPQAIVDRQGNVVGSLERDVFGAAWPSAGSHDSTPLRFPGQLVDEETGLHYNRFRYYDPEIGRYISPDPLGLSGGLNYYAYGVNPIGWIDPMGLKPHPVTMGAPTAFKTWVKENGHTNNGSSNKYLSGKANDSGNRCPPQLNNDASCHTEQKFAHDLIAWNRETEGGANGKKFRLKGDLPPCPNCHGAMMRAAQETGAEISYEWEHPKGKKNKVTYKGNADDKTVKVRASGRKAQELKRVYNHREQSTWGEDRKASHNLWGYESDTTARQKYQTMRDQRLRQMKKEKAAKRAAKKK
jgi:RHS repeat-associated protein